MFIAVSEALDPHCYEANDTNVHSKLCSSSASKDFVFPIVRSIKVNRASFL
jgi:hypothetical protein